jgi:hypothetical protein
MYFWQGTQICRILHLQTPTKSIIDWLQQDKKTYYTYKSIIFIIRIPPPPFKKNPKNQQQKLPHT